MSQIEPILNTRQSVTLRGPLPPVEDQVHGGSITLSVSLDLQKVEAEWRLLQQHADCTVFQSYEWLATWQRCVGEPHGVQPVIVRGRRQDGTLLFILPLAITSAGRLRRLTFLGHELCDYNAPLLASDFSEHVPSEDFPAFWAGLLDTVRETRGLSFDLILLDKMPEVIGSRPNPFIGLDVTLNPSGAYVTRLGKDWETFYREKRSSTSRRRDRTKNNRLFEHGETLMVKPEDPEDFALTFDTLVAQKREAFGRMGVPDLFSRPGYLDFFRAIADQEPGRRLSHLTRLQVGSTFAAVNLGLEFRRRYYYIMTSYADGELARFGPGRAHLQELMKYATERGFREFDFTIGDEPYKREWCDSVLKMYDHVAANSLRGTLAAASIRGLRRVKRRIKQSEALWPALTKARAFIAKLRGNRLPAAPE